MFGKKKYTLKFRKTRQWISADSTVYNVVTDKCLLHTLLKLKETCDFEILSVSFNDVYADSYIKIKCNKDDVKKIFTDYCLLLNGKIDHIAFEWR